MFCSKSFVGDTVNIKQTHGYVLGLLDVAQQGEVDGGLTCGMR